MAARPGRAQYLGIRAPRGVLEICGAAAAHRRKARLVRAAGEQFLRPPRRDDRRCVEARSRDPRRAAPGSAPRRHGTRSQNARRSKKMASDPASGAWGGGARFVSRRANPLIAASLFVALLVHGAMAASPLADEMLAAHNQYRTR